MKRTVFKIWTAIVVCAILSTAQIGCGSKLESRYVCNCDEQDKLQAFVKDGIKPANNMSDEEMEDVIRELRISAVRMFCKIKPVWVEHNGNVDWEKQTFDSCEVLMKDF